MKQAVAWVVAVAALAGALVLAYGMPVAANAQPVQPTWQQPVVTVDETALEYVAQTQWKPPFKVELAMDGRADITMELGRLEDMTGGEATKTVDGDRITGCHIVLRPSAVTPLRAMAHELGHCFGLPHDNGHSGSLMYWIQGGDSGADAVTDTDRAALADLYEGTK